MLLIYPDGTEIGRFTDEGSLERELSKSEAFNKLEPIDQRNAILGALRLGGARTVENCIKIGKLISAETIKTATSP